MFTKFREIPFSGSKDVSCQIWALKIPPYQAGECCKNLFSCKAVQQVILGLYKIVTCDDVNKDSSRATQFNRCYLVSSSYSKNLSEIAEHTVSF